MFSTDIYHHHFALQEHQWVLQFHMMNKGNDATFAFQHCAKTALF